MATDYPYNGRLSRWEEVADGLAIVGVTANDEPFAFEPGQYATLGLMGETKLVQRPMSISSPADDTSEYEFFIRRVPGGGFTPLLWEIGVGDPINIKGPKGKFLLQDDGRRCLFVATGTGLAPFMSMIDTLRARGQQRQIWLLHGVSYEHDLAWREELSELAATAAGGGFPLHYAATISRPGEAAAWRGLTGRAEAVLDAHLDEHELTADNTTIYLCGNPEMVSAVEEIAARRGFAPEHVRKELYWPKGRAH
jgi:ferredoxin-NADP reductase